MIWVSYLVCELEEYEVGWSGKSTTLDSCQCNVVNVSPFDVPVDTMLPISLSPFQPCLPVRALPAYDNASTVIIVIDDFAFLPA